MRQEQPFSEEKQRVSEIFGNSVDHYATERERTPYFQAQLAIVYAMLAGEHGRILDLGCAAGGEIPELRRRAFSVIGIDLSLRMLEAARRRFADDSEVQFCQADVEKLPFSSQSMDHVVCLGVFEFLPGYESALNEIHRVLRPGGLAVLAIPSGISLYNLSDRLVSVSVGPVWRAFKSMILRKHPRAPLVPTVHRNLCVPWKFRTLLRKHGFEPGRSRSSNFFVYPLDRFPDLNIRVAAALEPLASIPLLRFAASVYLVSARKK
jgi:ubiquinone/menaquinone biosynthesis C-methylase UbiE